MIPVEWSIQPGPFWFPITDHSCGEEGQGPRCPGPLSVMHSDRGDRQALESPCADAYLQPFSLSQHHSVEADNSLKCYYSESPLSTDFMISRHGRKLGELIFKQQNHECLTVRSMGMDAQDIGSLTLNFVL